MTPTLKATILRKKMFRKPQRKRQQDSLRKPKPHTNEEEDQHRQQGGSNNVEDEREEIESQIQNILEAQRVRQRRNGMDAVECAVGKELAKEFYRLDEDPFRMRGGRMLRLTDHQQAALNASIIEADIKEQFKKETLLRDEHEEMRRYVESRLKKEQLFEKTRNIDEGSDEQQPDSKRAKFMAPEDEILFNAAERVKKYTSKRSEELLSNQMLVGIPEVDLGIEIRMKNIEQTEQKKVEMLKKGILPERATQGWQKSNGDNKRF